jgi:ATP-binding cassette, subfamily G (WHITE), member 2, SNQ2
VSETLKFAASTKLPKSGPASTNSDVSYVDHRTDKILSSLGIAHTADTIVGDEFTRGVSGGERKRVSVAEVMATEVLSAGYERLRQMY